MTLSFGIFDSGVGGFTVLSSILKRHNVKAIYLGDTARVPYGNRSSEELRLYAREVTQWLNSFRLDGIVIACNTTNSLALDIVRKYSRFPVFPLINNFEALRNQNKIGVLATSSTVSSGYYERCIKSVNPSADVFQQSCPAFVPLIETGQLNSIQLEQVAYEYLDPLINMNVSSIVLGCSHYPLLRPLLEKLLPKYISILDPADNLAIQLDEFCGTPSIRSDKYLSFTNVSFFVTSDPIGFSLKAKQWLGFMPPVKHVSLQSRSFVS